jgi:hypothetical protein
MLESFRFVRRGIHPIAFFVNGSTVNDRRTHLGVTSGSAQPETRAPSMVRRENKMEVGSNAVDLHSLTPGERFTCV